MIEPSHELRAEPSGPAFSDAVTFAWADRDADVCGVVRLGLSPGPLGSALALLFADGAPASALAHGGVELSDDADWTALGVAGVRAAIDEPLQRWRVGGDFGDGDSFALAFEAIGAAAEVGMAGMTGYEHLCLVAGTVTVGGEEREVRCLGQRGHSWGEPDWERNELARTVTAWLDDGSGLTLSAFRPVGARAHNEEEVACALLGSESPVTVADPRLSTTYDGEGRQLRAGLELWINGEDGFPHRGAGRAFCGSTLDLGQLQLDCAFFEWSLDGRSGVGRYDILRRA